MLLNVTVVLPRFHTFFTERGEQRRLGDASAAVDMDFYYDVDAFISALAPMVSIVRRLPPALEAFARDEAVQEVDFLNPLLRSRELQRLAEHFHQHNALRLRSPARAVVWNTPRLARLRVLLHSALQPSPRVSLYTDHIIKSMGKFAGECPTYTLTYYACLAEAYPPPYPLPQP